MPAEIAPADLFAARPWRRITPADLGPARAVPAMLRDEESRFYFWLGRDWARGAGEIVDLGCFVGGSTARLAAGHAAGGHPGLVHAYDQFTASEEAKARHLYAAGLPAFEGEDILPVARALLEPWDRRITFHRGDLMTKRWSGDPVEVLVLDASKTVALADHCAAEFFPALIAGRSVVVQQDHLHQVQPWLPAQMELLADFFQPLVHCPRDSVSFLCTRVPSPAELAARRLSGLDDAGLIGLIERAAARLAPLCPAESFARQIDCLARRPGARSSWQLARKAPAKG